MRSACFKNENFFADNILTFHGNSNSLNMGDYRERKDDNSVVLPVKQLILKARIHSPKPWSHQNNIASFA